MTDILGGAAVIFQAGPLMWLVIGVVLGFVVGAIPGLGSANAAALILPFAIGLSPESSLILIGGLYAGCLFAGAIPAILVNVPGEAGSAATALDGHPMALAGQGERAIGIARMASAVGGVLSGVVVLLIIGPLGAVALMFGAREIFIVAIFGLAIIAIVIGDSVRKGLIAAILGLLIASMAANPYTGQPRFTMGFIELYSEIPFVPAVIGIFGIAEMLIIARNGSTRNEDYEAAVDTDVQPEAASTSGLRHAMREAVGGVVDTLRYPMTIIRSSAIGLLIGIVPGIGTSAANFVSYGVAKRLSKHPERFGKGEPDGVVASEACDNAVASGTLIPTLTLGIPGSATAAIVLAALYLHGIQPGPQLLATNSDLVYALVWAAILSSVLILPLGIVLAAPLALVARVRPAYLVPSILLFCLVGTYSVRNSMFDVWLMLIFAVLGYLMRRLDYPLIPLVLGLVLGPIAEENFLRAMQLGGNDVGYFFGSPIAIALWTGLLALIAFSIIRRPMASEDAPSHGREDNESVS